MKQLILIFVVLLISCKEEIKKENLIEKAIIEEPARTKVSSLEIYDYDGLEPILNAKDDKTYVINFWATWCAPCVKELPYFETLNTEYNSKNVEVILVSLDFPNQYEKRLIPFINEHELKSKIVVLNDVDSNSWIPKISKNWSGAIPASLIYNKDKRQFYEQSFNYDELKTEVDKFLN